MRLDLRRQAEHAHDLGDPGAGNPVPPGDLGLAGDVAGFQERLPLDGLAQEFDDPGRPGILGRFRLAPAWQDGAHDPVGGHTARQGADVAVLERTRTNDPLVNRGSRVFLPGLIGLTENMIFFEREAEFPTLELDVAGWNALGDLPTTV